MDKFNFFKQGYACPDAAQRRDTKLFYDNSVEIYERFGDWKDEDRFYFIPLYMQMTYGCAGIVAEIAPDPVWMGSFVTCTMEHPDLFQYRCPNCGRTVLPYRYVGSPLSGRVDLEGRCKCGWSGYEMVSGWRTRATALRERIECDEARRRRCSSSHSETKAPTVKDLLEWLRGR